MIKDSCGITLVDCDVYKNKGTGIVVKDTGAVKYVKKRQAIKGPSFANFQVTVQRDVFEVNPMLEIEGNLNETLREIIRGKQETAANVQQATPAGFSTYLSIHKYERGSDKVHPIIKDNEGRSLIKLKRMDDNS